MIWHNGSKKKKGGMFVTVKRTFLFCPACHPHLLPPPSFILLYAHTFQTSLVYCIITLLYLHTATLGHSATPKLPPSTWWFHFIPPVTSAFHACYRLPAGVVTVPSMILITFMIGWYGRRWMTNMTLWPFHVSATQTNILLHHVCPHRCLLTA